MSRTSSAQSPRSRALPAKLKPNGPGNISGKSVRTSDRHAAMGPSPDTLHSRPTVEAALYDGPHRICPALPQIGSANVRTPVTNAHTVCRLLLEQKKHTN